MIDTARALYENWAVVPSNHKVKLQSVGGSPSPTDSEEHRLSASRPDAFAYVTNILLPRTNRAFTGS